MISLKPSIITSTLYKKKTRKYHLKNRLHHLTWLCFLLACIGTSWFAYQTFLVPQPHTYIPDWHDAHWIEANDTTANASPIAYFRRSLQIGVIPDGASITITANQGFRLYINGNHIGTNMTDVNRGKMPQTYIYDVASKLAPGVNIVGIRVANGDQGTPQLLANISANWGHQNYNYGTDSLWQATRQTTLAHPRMSKTDSDWAKRGFNTTGWHNAQITSRPLSYPALMINPQIYQQPMPTRWMSAGAGVESYYVRSFVMPTGYENAFLRIVATGESDIFINNHLSARWNGLAKVSNVNVVNYMNSTRKPATYRNNLKLGIYDITPYLHTGSNTIAVHVMAPGTATAKLGLDTQRSAMSLEILVGTAGNYSNVASSPAQWHASLKPVTDWTNASSPALAWKQPELIGQPGFSRTFYQSDSNIPANVQIIAPTSLAKVISMSILAVLTFWLTFSLAILRHFIPSRKAALETACLVFLPALAFEAVLVVLSSEHLIPQPFPYTNQWGIILIAIVFLTALFLCFYARTIRNTRRILEQNNDWMLKELQGDRGVFTQKLISEREANPFSAKTRPTIRQRVSAWLKRNWGILPILLIAMPMVLYNPAYEPYWQDELASYYAAIGVMTHGIPIFPHSGFLYPKAELFSYLLAFVMTIFGTHSLVATRSISMLLFLASLPIFYLVGKKLFHRRVAWLATAMLAFSPYAMQWSRQARMYELAQFMVIIVVGVLYWALQNRTKIYPVCITMLCILLAYFSHEVIYVTFPALVICSLMASRKGPYGIPSILKQKHWWIAALITLAIIGIHLSIAILSHPPALGTDRSRRPQVELTTDNINYYFQMFFVPLRPNSNSPLLVVDSILAILGCVIAFQRKDQRARYCALFLIVSTMTLIFLFTMTNQRYYYPILPVYYLMAAYSSWNVLHTLWIFARLRLTFPHVKHWVSERLIFPSSIIIRLFPLLLRLASGATITFVCASLLLIPMLPLSNFNLFVSRALGLQYHRHFADYDTAGRFMHDHMLPGDTVIAITPAVIILYEVGKVDDFFSIDRALFLMEKNGQLTDTTTGSHPLLNEAELQTVLAKHSRIWFVADNTRGSGYLGGITKSGRFVFPPPGFSLVYEGYNSGVYFRNSTQ
jgi:4-amino-4-deoxy-L-arabinose transferase-like glycosyltransferase